jgi:hypothetical protein
VVVEKNEYQYYTKRIVNALLTKDVNSVLIEFAKPNNDKITNEVRHIIESLIQIDIKGIKRFLEELLNCSYGKKLCGPTSNYNHYELKSINADELFLIKENIIYYLGRLPILPNPGILKKAYMMEENKHLRLNIMFSSLLTFDENIESDFINKIEPGNEYDIMIRSWTMAFFSNTDNPYSYLDNKEDDWSKARGPRINRLNINDKKDPKFVKAMAFRLMDLTVLWLFLESRGVNNLTPIEKEIIANAYVEYPSFSLEKQNNMKDLKVKILKK